MKTILMTLLAAFGMATANLSSGVIDQGDIKTVHTQWMAKHGRTYLSETEESHRFGIFVKNLEMIMEHNMRFSMGEESYTMELNAHADLDFEEWSSKFLNYKKSSEPSDVETEIHFAPLIRGIEAPTSVDWRSKGAVTPVKDQAQCGSCWSFSSTGAMEGAHFLATGKLVSLSEEQLINCVNKGQFDCQTGGDMTAAFQYVIKNKGIVAESTWPYTSADHKTCKYPAGSTTAPYVATFSSYKSITANDENALKTAVAQQPVAVAIDASHPSFQFYSSGVYTEKKCCTNCQESDLDHGVLAVGYGTENGKDYWLIKNSWNSGWGDSGYIKMVRNDNARCGVAAMASYPIV